MTGFPGFRARAGSPGAERRDRRHGQARAASPCRRSPPLLADGREPPICRRRRPFLRRRAAEEEFSGWYLRGDVGGRRQCGGAETRDHARAARAARSQRKRSSARRSRRSAWSTSAPAIRRRAGFAPMRRSNIASAQASARARLTPGQGSAQTGDAFRADVASFVGLVNGYCHSRRLVRVFAFPRRWSWLRRQPAVERQRSRPRVGRRLRLGLETSFAWAAMAGVDYDLTARLKLELELPLSELWDGRDRRLRRLPGPRGSDLIPQQTGLKRLPAGPHLPDWRGVAGRRARLTAAA